MESKKHLLFESFPDANLNIRDLGEEYRLLEFDSKDTKMCEAYIAAIADVLSRMWPDDDSTHPAHVKEILLSGHVANGEIQSGHYSFPLSMHDALSDIDDKKMLDSIHTKAQDIYRQITT